MRSPGRSCAGSPITAAGRGVRKVGPHSPASTQGRYAGRVRPERRLGRSIARAVAALATKPRYDTAFASAFRNSNYHELRRRPVSATTSARRMGAPPERRPCVAGMPNGRWGTLGVIVHLSGAVCRRLPRTVNKPLNTAPAASYGTLRGVVSKWTCLPESVFQSGSFNRSDTCPAYSGVGYATPPREFHHAPPRMPVCSRDADSVSDLR